MKLHFERPEILPGWRMPHKYINFFGWQLEEIETKRTIGSEYG